MSAVDADGYPVESEGHQSTNQSTEQDTTSSDMHNSNQLSDPSGLKSPTSTSPALTSAVSPEISQSIRESTSQTASTSKDASPTQSSNQSNPPVNQSKPPIVPMKRASITSFKATLAGLQSGDDESFAFKDLTHSFPIVASKMETSLTEVKKVADFVGKVVKAKQAYSNSLFAALSELNKPPQSPMIENRTLSTGNSLAAPNSANDLSNNQSNGQRSRSASVSNVRSRSNSAAVPHDHEMAGKRSHQAWKTLRDIIEAEAISDARAAQAYQETVVQPLISYQRDAENKRKVLMEHFESMHQQVKDSHQRMLQTKIQVLKLLESQKIAEAREAHERDERAAAEAAGKLNDYELSKAGKGVKASLSFLFKNKKEQMTQALHSLSSDELRKQAYESVLMYETSVDVANSRTISFFEQDMPSILRQAQMMETQRLETLRMHLERLAGHFKGLADPSDQRIESFDRSVRELSTKSDIDDFAAELVAAVGTPVLPNKFIYDLGFTSDDVKNNRVIDVQGQSSAAVHSSVIPVFGNSLEQVMKVQAETHPELNVPFVLVSLCDSIRQLQAEKKTGIFNSSPAHEDLWKARRSIEAYQPVQTSDVEIPAAVLKMWLRDLHPRVISHDAYDRALFVARENACDHSAVLGVYYSLDELNQRVIRHIAELAAELVSDAGENDESYDKLALTLAPHLMQSSSSDSSTVLSAVNDEIKFTAALLEAVAADHAVKDQRGAASVAESAVRSTVDQSVNQSTDVTNQSSNPSSNQSSNQSTGSIDEPIPQEMSDSELEPHPSSDDDRQLVDVHVTPNAST